MNTMTLVHNIKSAAAMQESIDAADQQQVLAANMIINHGVKRAITRCLTHIRCAKTQGDVDYWETVQRFIQGGE